MPSITTLATAALIALLPAVQGHMAIWDESVYGFNDGDSNVPPLAGMSFNQWWFHGKLNDKPSKVKTLVPGQDVNFEISCSKWHTSFTGNSGTDACPNDAGAYHAGGTTGSQSGWSGNNEDNMLGCALAIAYKSNPADVKPEDFTVFSVQERCVRQKDTSFSVPSNLPACPDGECTCAWFWQGKNSANEMYMNAFRCNVQGGTNGAIPQPAEPRKGKISGPTQPMYWANDINNVGYSPEWATKPSYNSAWGWTNGAQTGAFGAGGGNAPAPPNNNTSNGQAGPTGGEATSSSGNGQGDWAPSSTSSRRRRPRPTTSTANDPDWPVYAASPTGGQASPTASGSAGNGDNAGCTRRRKRSHGKRGHKKRSRAHTKA